MSSGKGVTTTTKKTVTSKTTSSKGAGGALKKGKKKIAAAPLKAKAESKKVANPLYEKRAKNFGIGQGKQPFANAGFDQRPMIDSPCIQTFNPNVISHVSLNGHNTSVFNVNAAFCSSV